MEGTYDYVLIIHKMICVKIIEILMLEIEIQDEMDVLKMILQRRTESLEIQRH